MNDVITIITKDHGSFSSKIDSNLQESNPLTGRGIYLVAVDNGVVWGYDTTKYEYDNDQSIVRKQRLVPSEATNEEENKAN